MKRTVIVVTATAAGLIGVLAFHTSPQVIKLVPDDNAGSAPGSASPSPSPSPSKAAPSPSKKAPAKPVRSRKPRPKPTATTPASTTRTVDGPSVNFSYGTLSVAVTVTGSKIVKVGIASLDDDNVPKSESIDQAAIPVLEREALAAQSGNIQSVSGASYTSAGFRTSLQAALRTLGLD
jgi:uncharacterized protein with FMN-binding domain